jgi:hypothetical protein
MTHRAQHPRSRNGDKQPAAAKRRLYLPTHHLDPHPRNRALTKALSVHHLCQPARNALIILKNEASVSFRASSSSAPCAKLDPAHIARANSHIRLLHRGHTRIYARARNCCGVLQHHSWDSAALNENGWRRAGRWQQLMDAISRRHTCRSALMARCRANSAWSLHCCDPQRFFGNPQ